MIGAVGPRDSVAQVAVVAEEMDLGVPLLTRVYRTPASAVDIVRELDQSCSVILCTGRVPFALASAALSPRAHLEYVSHEGADLLRVVARLLMRPKMSADRLRVSLDGIETALAEEIFVEVGLGADAVRTIPLVLRDSGVDYSAREIAEQHQELHLTGEVDVCLTTLDSVRRLLARRGVPVERITHTKMVVRAALERCRLATRLGRAAAAQLAVFLVAPAATAPDDDEHRRLADALARHVALRMDAEMVGEDARLAKLVTTRGAVERWLSSGPLAKVRDAEFAGVVDFGYGLGETVVLAERNARRALAHARREGRPFLVRDDGVALPTDSVVPSYRSLVTHPATLRTSREVGLSPVSLQRLVHVLGRMDSETVTASGLASSYGFSERSARRLLAKLVAGGYAESVGVEKGLGAGRPQAVYQVRVERLVSVPGPR